MATYEKKYNPNRNADWNYGGAKWRLSRSKIDLFVECPRCFYLDNKLGTARPRGPAFTLNVAVDALLKKEFDVHRAEGSSHPLMDEYNVEAIPFDHEKMGTWRENFEGIEHKHAATGFTISGAVDDIWVDADDNLIVVDYKATSKEGDIVTLADSSWEDQYRRQIGVYQWLLEQNGFPVAKTGYFVYANATTAKDSFAGQLDFKVTLVPCEGDTSWIEPTLEKIKTCLSAETLPASSDTCEYCTYRTAAGKKLQAIAKQAKNSPR
jgi:hypothetical protein